MYTLVPECHTRGDGADRCHDAAGRSHLAASRRARPAYVCRERGTRDWLRRSDDGESCLRPVPRHDHEGPAGTGRRPARPWTRAATGGRAPGAAHSGPGAAPAARAVGGAARARRPGVAPSLDGEEYPGAGRRIDGPASPREPREGRAALAAVSYT